MIKKTVPSNQKVTKYAKKYFVIGVIGESTHFSLKAHHVTNFSLHAVGPALFSISMCFLSIRLSTPCGLEYRVANAFYYPRTTLRGYRNGKKRYIFVTLPVTENSLTL